MEANKKSIGNNDNNNTKRNSNSIDLENLQKRYSNSLIEYKQSVTDYINYLNNNNNNKSFVDIKGQSYLGSGTLQQIDNTNLNNCKALCSSNKTCSGATFKSNSCILKTGDSNIISSSNDSYAIIPEGKKMLMVMEKLNNELMNLNKEITSKLNILEPYLEDNINKRNDNSNDLIESYNKLLNERENIIELLNDYKTLDNTQNENEIKVTQNYYLYIIYFILTIISIVFLFKISFSSETIRQNNLQYGGGWWKFR